MRLRAAAVVRWPRGARLFEASEPPTKVEHAATPPLKAEISRARVNDAVAEGERGARKRAFALVAAGERQLILGRFAARSRIGCASPRAINFASFAWRKPRVRYACILAESAFIDADSVDFVSVS